MGLSDRDFIRYSRQILLPECGEAGQVRLGQSRIAIVGCGGLGCSVAQQLAAAGVGHISLFDGDTVELSNLPRQLAYDDRDLGQGKAQVLAARLARRYPGGTLSAAGAITAENVDSALSGKDLVLDCSDNFATRHRVNASCQRLNLPLISAAISGFEGQLLLVTPGEGPCYQCLYPEDTQSAGNCAAQGVLGPAVAVMASMQALLALKLLLGLDCNSGRLLRFNGLSLSWHEARLEPDPLCPICALRLGTSKTPDSQVIPQGRKNHVDHSV
ncbi:HesA/MoeB/ThiF family protein [Shewanella sedimentimangrovi]|uniref:HesA/MoeB/ThiF family protein n=1 Tax=Shewanella sedimentimangrovi TaxID=2814293 RepID=A0ABX7R7U0_9GAMM|nr:HesA/MoeB/ThiF family protein [Shewanella sedimentimangrovi]QSX38825.1 HesA/MoeB/ThiF family protein [Shewanella sedimentimangrovi]